jgi:putative membrane protein
MIAALRIGLGLTLVGLVLWLRGTGDVTHALEAAGWTAIAAVSAYHLISIALCGTAWRSLLADAPPGATATFIFARWVRDGVNQLLPLMPLGGEVAGARVVAARGVPGADSAALTVVDVTAETLSQAIFSLIGVALWLRHDHGDGLLGPAGIGIGLSALMLGGLILAQKLGMVRLLERLADKVMPDAWRQPGVSVPIHDRILLLYTERRRFTIAAAIHLAGWLVATGEAWIILRLIGHPLPIAEVIAMESVVAAIRSAAFLVPGALGVQESAYVLVGAALGLPAEAALAVSLIKRGREITMGVPALLMWQWRGRRRTGDLPTPAE